MVVMERIEAVTFSVDLRSKTRGGGCKCTDSRLEKDLASLMMVMQKEISSHYAEDI